MDRGGSQADDGRQRQSRRRQRRRAERLPLVNLARPQAPSASSGAIRSSRLRSRALAPAAARPSCRATAPAPFSLSRLIRELWEDGASDLIRGLLLQVIPGPVLGFPPRWIAPSSTNEHARSGWWIYLLRLLDRTWPD